MHDSLKSLLQLQEIDSQIIFLRSAKEKRPRELEGDRRRVDEKKKMVEGLGLEIKKTKMDGDRRELDLKKNEAEIQKLQVNLNQAKSNQEYQILKEQIARLHQENGRIEEEVLKRMGEADNLEQVKRSSEEELKGNQRELQKKVEELNEILKGIDEEMAALQARRDAATRSVPPDHLQLYQRILVRHGDSALARVEHQVCQGCFMAVTPQTMNLLLQDKDLSQCRNCLRILYLD